MPTKAPPTHQTSSIRPPTADHAARVPAKSAGPAGAVQARFGNRFTGELLSNLRAMMQGGQAIPAQTRRLMESLLGADFGKARLHTGPDAARLAQGMQAAAVSLGSHIYFNRGVYQDDEAGLSLLAHELAHVAQWQNSGAPMQQAVDGSPRTGWIRQAEQEAGIAEQQAGQGRRTSLRSRLLGLFPLRHPVYISRHGSRGFLTVAQQFFQRWGYAPITTGVDSIEQVLADLARKPSIDRVTIVTHAHPTNMMMAMFNGGPGHIRKEQWEVDTPEELLETETHTLDDEFIGRIVQDLRDDPEHRRRLARIGEPTDPLLRQYIHWAVEYEYVTRAGFSRRRKRDLQRLIEANLNRYRDTMLIASAAVAAFGDFFGNEPYAMPTARDFDRLRESIRAVTRRYRFPDPGRDERRIARQLQTSPSRTINRVLLGPFFQNLAAVRAKIRPGTWIEIQGCRIGQDRDYVVALQRFFSSERHRPRVTAPRWFQFFGVYGFQPVPDSPRQIRRMWNRASVQSAFHHWYPILTGQAVPPDADHETLADFLRTPHALPLATPDAPGRLSVLFLSNLGQEAFLAWLSRHGYRLTQPSDIEDALFSQRSLSRNVGHSVIDWLQENRRAPTRRVFRPDPEYRQHIEDVR